MKTALSILSRALLALFVTSIWFYAEIVTYRFMEDFEDYQRIDAFLTVTLVFFTIAFSVGEELGKREKQ